MQVIHEIINSKGIYHVEAPLDKQDWLDVLHDKSISQKYINTLLLFYYEKGHEATCAQLSEKYDRHSSSILSDIKNLGAFVQKKYNFSVQNIDGNDSYWGTVMDGKKVKDGFLWIVKPELSEAILSYLYEEMFSVYKDLRKKYPIDDSKQDEKYKWNYITKFHGTNDLLAIADFMKTTNLVYTAYANTTIGWLIANKREEFSEALKELSKEKVSLEVRVKQYAKVLKALNKDNIGAKSYFAHDERTVSAILGCYDPNQYTFYMNEVYQGLCSYLSVTPQKVGAKYAHFLTLLQPLVKLISEDIDLKTMIAGQTEGCEQSDLLTAQDVCWELFKVHTDKLKRDYLKNTNPVYWFVGYCWGHSDSKLEQFVAANEWQGIFGEEGNADQLVLAKKIKEGDYLIFKASSTKGTNHDIPFLRIPCVGKVVGKQKEESVSSDDSTEPSTKITIPLRILTLETVDFDGNKYGKYRNTIQECKEQEIIDYVESINNMKEVSPYQGYIDLLVANHNVILNGAPGTGKTYLAKKIAEVMGAEVKMVQFHPSFDYSDFVEGLRPVKNELGNIGFVRKDGIFKEFCRVALQNLKDSKKDVKILQKEKDVSEILDEYITEKIENGEEMQTASRRNKFVLIDQDEKNIKVNIPDNPIVKDVLVSKTDVISILLDDKAKIDNVKSIREYFGRSYNTQADSYAFVIFNDLKSRKAKTSTVQVEAIKAKDFVFIIDEINRGEISKIFGELFFSIDPGYRGEKGKVQTQYQNLVEDGDVFKDGFFVPENVYIIGTMNDIDRSVESMDFAMRRRFAWHEVTAEESAKNMRLNEELTMRMSRLNEVISNTEGLGSAYHVGGSFFLKVQNGEMTVESLWNLNLKSLMKEYLRGLPDADEVLESMENAYFLKGQKSVSGNEE